MPYTQFSIVTRNLQKILFLLNRLLATTSADQSVKIWQTSNFQLLSTLKPHYPDPAEPPHGWMWDCDFSADSQFIITGNLVSISPR